MRIPCVTLLLAATCCAVARPADAFLLLGKSKKVANDATAIVAMREGERTVLTVRAHYRGPAETVALLVPLPASRADKPLEAVAQVPFEGLARLTGPRLSELWEQDPCTISLAPAGPPEDASDASPAPSEPSAPAAAGTDAYAFEPATAKTGADMAQWLKDKGFEVPKGAADVIDEYLQSGRTFVLTEIDPSKLTLEDGATWLPPLRMVIDGKDFSLPTKLEAVSGRGTTHDLMLYVLAPAARYEAANAPNVAVPTNLDVKAGARAKLDPFYAALVHKTFEKYPDAILTEYAWRASSCAPCPAPAVTLTDLPLLGSDLLPSAVLQTQHEVLVEAPTLATRPDGPEWLRPRLEACYAQALSTDRNLGGEVTIDVMTGPAGEVLSFATKGTPNEALAKCATDTLRGTVLDKKSTTGPIKLQFLPRSRAFYADFVLSRLRARLTKVPEHDLELRAGRPIEGGREIGPKGSPEKSVYAAESADNFQPRYVIRHRWPGKLECEVPKRGVWGGPPADAPEPKADEPSSKKDGKAAKTIHLDKVLDGKLPDLAAYEMAFEPGAPPPAPTPRPAPPAAPTALPSASAAPSGGPGAPVAPAANGCGCRLAPARSPRTSGLVMALGLLVAARRRRRPLRRLPKSAIRLGS